MGSRYASRLVWRKPRKRHQGPKPSLENAAAESNGMEVGKARGLCRLYRDVASLVGDVM